MSYEIQGNKRRFVIVACEASGDQLGAGLVRALKVRFPGCLIEGVGGDLMKDAGAVLWFGYDELAVMGIVEVLKHLPRLLRLRKDVVARTIAFSPDAYIGIDGPDFNLGVEKRLKARGIHALHYVSPSIWAWREGRANKIKQCADRVICLFPMEPPIYDRYGMPSSYVGHPLANEFEQHPSLVTYRRRLGIEDQGIWLGILPGSRVGEIEKLGRIFLQAALLLRRERPGLKIIIPTANARAKEALFKVIDDLHVPQSGDLVVAGEVEWAGLRADSVVIDGRSHDVMKASNALMLASGTAALEGMLAKRPMVVAYRLAPLTHFIVKSLGLLKIDRYSLPNVLAGRSLVPEMMQDNCMPELIAAAMSPLLSEDGDVQERVATFHELHELLRGTGDAGAAQAVAEVIEAS